MDSAARGGSARIVCFLSENGVSPLNAPQDADKLRGCDCISPALIYRGLEVVLAFLAGGMDVDSFTGLGSFLSESTRMHHELLAVELLVRGANINLQKKKDSGTPLLYATTREMTTVVKLLLERHADDNQHGTVYQTQTGTRTNQQKDEGFSALHGAAGHGPHSFSRMLIEGYKENLNVRLLNSSLPIYTTAARGNPQSLQACLDAGVEIDVTNNDAMTPLHLAAASNQWVNVIFLLDKGASNDVKTDEGLSLDEERVAGGLLIGRIGMMRN
ncbi:hypothetical protein MMC21_003993 [Puttea exsequens]|nr:hypothetical protein [Puttea exsequens]